MIKRNVRMITALVWAFFGSFNLVSASEIGHVEELRAAAERFIQVVDKNDAEALSGLLHADMLQYVQMGEKLIPFKAADFIQMVADKKIGGVIREIKHQSAGIVRGETASVIVNAVSHEYDFMYQLSMVKSADQWLIVGILVDIKPVG